MKFWVSFTDFDLENSTTVSMYVLFSFCWCSWHSDSVPILLSLEWIQREFMWIVIASVEWRFYIYIYIYISFLNIYIYICLRAWSRSYINNVWKHQKQIEDDFFSINNTIFFICTVNSMTVKKKKSVHCYRRAWLILCYEICI